METDALTTSVVLRSVPPLDRHSRIVGSVFEDLCKFCKLSVCIQQHKISRSAYGVMSLLKVRCMFDVDKIEDVMLLRHRLTVTKLLWSFDIWKKDDKCFCDFRIMV